MTIELSLLFVGAGCIISVFTFFIGRMTSARKDGERWGRLETEVSTIRTDVVALGVKIDENIKHNKESMASVHNRLDDHLREEHDMKVPRRE